MGTAVEADGDLGFGDGDIGGHVDQITKDLPGLGVVVTPHKASYWRWRAVAGCSKNLRQSVRLFGALIATTRQSHIRPVVGQVLI